MVNKLTGIPASPGIAIGEVYFIKDNENISIEKKFIDNVGKEIKRFQEALILSEKKLIELKDKMSGILSSDELEIYDAHMGILQDPELIEQTIHRINTENINAEYALDSISQEFINEINEIDDEYLRSRVKDIEEVVTNVITVLYGITDHHLNLNRPAILVSQKITTHLLSTLNNNFILGIITAEGGPTDHTAIISKAMGIPLVVGINEQIQLIQQNSILIVDADLGKIHIDPDETTMQSFRSKQENDARSKIFNLETCKQPATTRSGKTIKVFANIGSAIESKAAETNGADGVGLLRTEICFMNRSGLPSEEEQYNMYKEMMDALPGKEFVIRLLDIGSDKKLPYLDQTDEENPAMGSRALRLAFNYYDTLLKPQLRAILRLMPSYNIHILCPMIATPKDLLNIKQAIANEKIQLETEGIHISKKIQIGIMVEIPNVALMPELFVEEADFFSFGTNDLAQYLVAADRTNSAVIDYLPEAIPAILKLIENVCSVANAAGKWVGICGELASNKDLIQQFIKMGVVELSMPPALIPEIKAFIRGLE